MADTFDSVVTDIKGLTARQIAEFAVSENAKIVGDTPKPLTVVRHVDGVQGAPESAVKEGGVIVYDYGRLDQVAEFALDVLRQLSPVRSGQYAQSHVLMINGKVVDTLTDLKPGDRLTISNTQPYTRKIELGRKGFRRHAHVYEKAEKLVNRRFGNIARVIFTFETAPKGAIHTWAASTSLSHKGHASDRSREEWLTRQPTLIIEEYS